MVKRILAALLLGAATSFTAGAQVSPDVRWLTLRTDHFNIRFTPELEHEARRAAVNAERAYSQLSAELVRPRGKIELVISDNVDYTNGYAKIFPFNTIVIFAHPPTDAVSLRNYSDWSQLVITHELAHIFHLDRARGIWALGRNIFGRHPALFPNALNPSWMTEGLAVYYESRLTGAGRLEGSFHGMVARGAASTGRIPALADLSLASTRFPGGEGVYVYGSLLFDHLSQTRGPQTIRTFVEESAGALPFFRGRAVKKAFGMSFERAWRQWSDSLLKITPRDPGALAQWRDLTRDARVTSYPRWTGDTILASVANGKESVAMFAVYADGRRTSRGRRNAIQANVPMPDGSILFAQPEYLSPYEIRTDLYLQRGDKQVRLTRGARLRTPDANGAGRILAVQAVPGTTRLVLVSGDGKAIKEILKASVMEQWAEPRWSPDGSRIAAVRISRGGTSAIVVMDTLGKVIAQTDDVRAVDASPSWSPNGAEIFFSSDSEGAPELYVWSVGDNTPRRISSAVTGMFSPEVSPDGRRLASVLYTGKGYHLGVAPLAAETGHETLSVTSRRKSCAECVIASARKSPAYEESQAPVVAYSARETLFPRFWQPVLFGSNTDGTEWGAETSGADVIGRHEYYARSTIQTRYHQMAGFLAYRYSGFGLPLLDLAIQQSWDRGPIYSRTSGNRVGRLDRRDRLASARLSYIRPKFRSAANASLGVELEVREYSSSPDSILARLPERFQGSRRFPAIMASAAWTNTQRPTLSISREDGITVNASARQRWRQGTSGLSTRTIIGSTAAYKSLDLPGFAHHVIAARIAGGYADSRAISSLRVGGISGSSLDYFPGYSIGDGPRTFGVRGFAPSVERGIRAVAASVEYRAPIAAPGRGIRWLPLFLDRVSADVFADAGRAYCPAAAVSTAEACDTGDVGNPWIGSLGAELNLDTGVQRDLPFRFRLGAAVPVAAAPNRPKKPSVYLTAGSSF